MVLPTRGGPETVTSGPCWIRSCSRARSPSRPNETWGRRWVAVSLTGVTAEAATCCSEPEAIWRSDQNRSRRG